MTTDVLLIHPPVNFKLKGEPAMSSLYIGYGLLHIAAALRKSGYTVTVWNLEEALMMGIPEDVIKERIISLDPKIVGVEMNWVHFGKGALQTARLVKEALENVPVIIGGLNASFFAKEIVQKYHDVVDGVLRGEAEKTFLKVAESVEKGGNLKDIGGLVWFEGKVRDNPLRKDDLYENIDEIPPYSWRVVKHVIWDVPMTRAPLMVSINSCRGQCPYKCVYCVGGKIGSVMGRTKYTVHSPEWIVEQVNLLREEGAEEFAFQDDLYLAGKKRLINIMRTLRKEGVTDNVLGFNMTSIPGFLDRETLKEACRAGVFNIDYGVETGSADVLRICRRPTTIERILDSMKVTISEGIIPFTWWMTGLPGETFEDIDKTFKLIDQTISLGGIPKWVTPVIAIPGTDMFDRAEEYGVKLRLKTFDDFLVFSDLKSRHMSSHLAAITHETEHMSAYDILNAALSIKRYIYSKRKEILWIFKKHLNSIASRHPNLSADMLEKRIKDHIDYIPKTFF